MRTEFHRNASPFRCLPLKISPTAFASTDIRHQQPHLRVIPFRVPVGSPNFTPWIPSEVRRECKRLLRSAPRFDTVRPRWKRSPPIRSIDRWRHPRGFFQEPSGLSLPSYRESRDRFSLISSIFQWMIGASNSPSPGSRKSLQSPSARNFNFRSAPFR